MKMRITLKNSDNLGVLSSTLCLIHCLVTPFIYISFASLFSQNELLSFSWKSINLIFIVFRAIKCMDLLGLAYVMLLIQ